MWNKYNFEEHFTSSFVTFFSPLVEFGQDLCSKSLLESDQNAVRSTGVIYNQAGVLTTC